MQDARCHQHPQNPVQSTSRLVVGGEGRPEGVAAGSVRLGALRDSAPLRCTLRREVGRIGASGLHYYWREVTVVSCVCVCV
jgi:hypothetical protein